MDNEKLPTVDEKLAEEDGFRVPPFTEKDFVRNPMHQHGLRPDEIFGKDPSNLSEDELDAIVGPSSRLRIRDMNDDGTVTEHTGKELRQAVRDGKFSPPEPPAAEEPEAEAAGEQETEDPPPDEAAPEEPEPEAEAKPEEEPEADAEPKKQPTRRHRRREARYRAKEAENAALRAKLAEYERMHQAPAPEAAAVDDIPKAADFDDDDDHAAAVRDWHARQIAAHDAAYAERHRQARAAGDGADERALDRAVRAEFAQVTKERFTPAQIRKNNAAVQAITSKALGGNAGSVPVANFMARRRAQLDAAGVLSEDAKSTGEVMADLYGEPKTLAAFEDLTGNGHILAGLATLDDPLPVVRYLVSEEGKTKVEDLDRLSATRPEAVAARVVTIAHQALSNGAAAPGEPAQVAPEISQAPRPGTSPRAASRTAHRPDPPAAAAGGLDPLLQREFDKVLGAAVR